MSVRGFASFTRVEFAIIQPPFLIFGKNTTEIIIDTKTNYSKAENAFSNYGKDPSTLNITIYTTSGTVFDETYLGLAGNIHKIEQ